ncbi:hypothetical protein, partial [Pseudomonas sp. SDO5561_S422]
VVERSVEGGAVFGLVTGWVGDDLEHGVAPIDLKKLPPSLLNEKGGGCTRVSRPVNRKTGAPEGAPRTATINWGVKRVPIEFRLLNPITENQRRTED